MLSPCKRQDQLDLKLFGRLTNGFARSCFKQGKNLLRVLRRCCKLYFKLFLVELSEQDARVGCLRDQNFSVILSKKCRARKKFKGRKKQ
jgi:hypothetical protein